MAVMKKWNKHGISMLVVAALDCVMACAHPPPPSQPVLISPPAASGSPPALRTRIELDVVVDAWRQGKTQIVQPSQVLNSGERIWVHVRAKEPVSIYLYYFKDGNRPQLIYSTKAGETLEANQWLSMPPDDKYLILDNNPGEEDLLILANRGTPLGLEGVAKKLEAILPYKKPRRPAAPHANPRPGVTSAPIEPKPAGFSRPMGFLLGDGSSILFDPESGLSIYQFRFRHAS